VQFAEPSFAEKSWSGAVVILLGDASGAADDEVENGTDKSGENDDKDPYELVVSFGRLVGNAIDQRPDYEYN
jgi:hypothetical protein